MIKTKPPKNPIGSIPEVERNDCGGIDMPAEIRDLFKNPPLLEHESPQLYWWLVRQNVKKLQPDDIIDWLLLLDFVNQSWDTIRYYHIKAALINVDQRAALAEIFAPVGAATADDLEFYAASDDARKLAEKWFDQKSKGEVEKRLRKYRLDAGSIAAVSFARQAAKLEIVERLLAALEIRRAHTLREYYQHRERTGLAVRHTSQKVLDAEAPAIAPQKEAAE